MSIRLSAKAFCSKRVLTTNGLWSGFETIHVYFRICGELLVVDDL
jgi:hypothetical protein